MMLKKTVLTIILLFACTPIVFANQFNLAKNYYKNGDIHKAKINFYQYYQRNPHSYKAPFALYYYARLQNDFNYVLRLLNTINAKYPNFPLLDKVLDELASLYFLTNDYRQSYNHYKELFQRFNKSKLKGKACFYMAHILIINNQSSRARSFLLSFYNDFSNDIYYSHLLYLIGKTYQLEKNYKNAIAYYQQIKIHIPYSAVKPAALYQLGLCYLKLNKRNISYQHFIAIIKSYPKSLYSNFAKRLLKQHFSRSSYKSIPSVPTLSKYSKGYFLQAGVFANKNNAFKLKQKINQLGFNSYVITVKSNRKKLFKTMVGNFKTRKEAADVLKYLSLNGVKTILKN